MILDQGGELDFFGIQRLAENFTNWEPVSIMNYRVPIDPVSSYLARI